MNLPEIGTPVIITWFDSTTTSGWAGRATTPSVRKILTLGWLVGTSRASLRGVGRASRAYDPRRPADCVLYQIVRDHYETFRVHAASRRDGEE